MVSVRAAVVGYIENSQHTQAVTMFLAAKENGSENSFVYNKMFLTSEFIHPYLNSNNIHQTNFKSWFVLS